MKCPYCGKPAEWVENKEIYGKNYGRSYMMWVCRPCDARVGCHNNTRNALGTLANAELRMWRMKAHNAIDPLWRGHVYGRSEVYGLLAKQFGMEVHIGQSDIEMCKKIIHWVSTLK